ncbi:MULTISPECIES: ATP-binding protein [unclassified Brenneria]|uniref:ATP-binding protein n=1 Tax=unclassified Brenneria TaxID=2634434 RepID=UPI0018F0AF0B|nr:ATP-binding protein [Brenneria sp. L3-3C-1]MBJ7223605.1 ATP-binding protein [Brenneria sp. L3-3C-1]MEE3644847.1 ATP-binding protein [Brenneria sp. L3_3C_1]
MSTIHLKTDQNRLIANLRHAFNPSSMLGELLQNARRAQAEHIHVTVEGDTLTVSDDGIGMDDLQDLIFIAHSNWCEKLQARENAFGFGALSTLYFADRLSVHSRDLAFTARTEQIISGDSVVVYHKSYRPGTELRLEGVKPAQAGQDLTAWVEQELQRLCEAFPVPIWFNGAEVPRPLTRPGLRWRETSMGKVRINLAGRHTQWRCFLQGLPIGRMPSYNEHQVVLLPDNTLAKLPDRQHLLNEAEEHPRIQAAVNEAYRAALVEVKQTLTASEFVEHYAQECLNSPNADLLNDVPFVPRGWFRDWSFEPAGFRHYWRHYMPNGILAREVVEQLGVWQIENEEDDAPTAEVYLEAAGALLFEEPGLDDGHWLKRLIRTVTPEQVQVKMGAGLHRDSDPGLADYQVELELVETLHVRLEGAPEYAVPALRKGCTLYLTAAADGVTRLVSDYIFDDRYAEDREDEDARYIATFIAVGCSSSPDRVVEALLPDALRHTAQPKLAGAVIHLTFDETGKLQSVSA